MPSTATLTHNDWLLGKIPDRDLDTTSTQINVTFPYWKKGMEPQDVVDFSNSDIDARISKSWNRGDFWNP